MRREDILYSLDEMPDVQIFEANDKFAVVYDEQQGKEIVFNFLENFEVDDLAQKINLSPKLPNYAQIDKMQLARYLMATVDKNTFITLESLWIVADDDDYRRMASEFGADALLFCEEDEKDSLGRMWFEKNVCMVDVGNIIRATNQRLDKLSQIKNFDFQKHIRHWILLTIIHELRHLQLDTNIVLSTDEYPLVLGEERNVQIYARETYEGSNPEGVFIGN